MKNDRRPVRRGRNVFGHRSPSLVVLGLMGALMLAGCSAFAPDQPAIADSTFVDIMADLHLVDAQFELGYEGSPGIRDSVLARHGADRSEYEETIRFYVEHPQQYAELYRQVLDHLAAERSGIGISSRDSLVRNESSEASGGRE